MRAFFKKNEDVDRIVKINLTKTEDCQLAAALYARDLIDDEDTLVNLAKSGKELRLSGPHDDLFPTTFFYVGFTDGGAGYGARIWSIAEYNRLPEEQRSKLIEVVYLAKSEGNGEKRTLVTDNAVADRYKRAIVYLSDERRRRSVFQSGAEVEKVYGPDGEPLFTKKATTKSSDGVTTSSAVVAAVATDEAFKVLEYAGDLHELLKDCGTVAEMQKAVSKMQKSFKKLQKQHDTFMEEFEVFLAEQQEKAGQSKDITVVTLTQYMLAKRPHNVAIFSAHVSENPDATVKELMELFKIKKSDVKDFLKKQVEKQAKKKEQKPADDAPTAITVDDLQQLISDFTSQIVQSIQGIVAPQATAGDSSSDADTDADGD